MISRDMTVHDVIHDHPELKETFVEYGFKKITDPLKLMTVAKIVTIEGACSMKRVDLDDFLNRLNEIIADKEG